MRHLLTLVCLAALILCPASSAAQLIAAKDGAVVYGHHHLNVTSAAAHTAFLVDALGGVPVTVAGRTIIRFPNVLVFMREQAPTGGSIGTTADHLGLSLPNLEPVIARLKAGGYRMITREVVPADWSVTDDITRNPAGGNPIAFVLGPDDLKVELVQASAQRTPVALQHVHFHGPERERMQVWYIKVLGAEAGPMAPGGRFLTATLPGVSLHFSASTTPLVGTKGRVVDHVGFEVDGLPALLKRLETLGVTAENVRRVPELGIDIAFITDPWGTFIELTEGLDRIQ